MPLNLPPALFVAAGVHAIASVGALVAYARDKRAAIKHEWRTSERTLHLWALAGGWPGALLAQRVYHHKTRKRRFQMFFWLASVVSLAVWSGAVALFW